MMCARACQCINDVSFKTSHLLLLFHFNVAFFRLSLFDAYTNKIYNFYLFCVAAVFQVARKTNVNYTTSQLLICLEFRRVFIARLMMVLLLFDAVVVAAFGFRAFFFLR